ncbi:TIM barrel protein [uncultured Draconibacterium sp.]|uniref:sugar phosphate isomerase/epimerase family protein n=1 Tax=uncultured Draconibacterium sp. TaxID=1573823 RepID=UPI0032178258
MVNRRQALIQLGVLAGGSLFLPGTAFSQINNTPKKFRYCLNTSTISGCGRFNVVDYINIAAKAGYDAVELWVGDVKEYQKANGTLDPIKDAIRKNSVSVENAIGFAPWLSGQNGLEQMKTDMKLMAEIECKRIAAPPVGCESEVLDLFKTGEQYKKLLDIGRETGVMPQLEFWGASDLFWHLGQAVMVTSVAGDKDARILPDIFHMFKGGSDFNSLNMINGDLIDVFHLNDYDVTAPKAQQTDADRIYPGDGGAPIGLVINYLNNCVGEKVLSLELFNKNYWENDALELAKTGLAKMKDIVEKSLAL